MAVGGEGVRYMAEKRNSPKKVTENQKKAKTSTENRSLPETGKSHF